MVSGITFLNLVCEAWIISLNFLFEASPQIKIAHSLGKMTHSAVRLTFAYMNDT
jgi:hypothetical protein